MTARPDLYAILGVARTATPAEIRAAYRALAKKLHPDVSHEPDAEERFEAIQQAADVLSDPTARRRYDEGTYDFARNTRTSSFMQMIEDGLVAVIEGVGAGDPRQIDVVKMLRQMADHVIEITRMQITKHQRVIAGLNAVKGRFTVPDGSANYLEMAVTRRTEVVEDLLKDNQNILHDAEDFAAFLKGASFRFDVQLFDINSLARHQPGGQYPTPPTTGGT